MSKHPPERLKDCEACSGWRPSRKEWCLRGCLGHSHQCPTHERLNQTRERLRPCVRGLFRGFRCDGQQVLQRASSWVRPVRTILRARSTLANRNDAAQQSAPSCCRRATQDAVKSVHGPQQPEGVLCRRRPHLGPHGLAAPVDRDFDSGPVGVHAVFMRGSLRLKRLQQS